MSDAKIEHDNRKRYRSRYRRLDGLRKTTAATLYTLANSLPEALTRPDAILELIREIKRKRGTLCGLQLHEHYFKSDYPKGENYRATEKIISYNQSVIKLT